VRPLPTLFVGCRTSVVDRLNSLRWMSYRRRPIASDTTHSWIRNEDSNWRGRVLEGTTTRRRDFIGQSYDRGSIASWRVHLYLMG